MRDNFPSQPSTPEEEPPTKKKGPAKGRNDAKNKRNVDLSSEGEDDDDEAGDSETNESVAPPQKKVKGNSEHMTVETSHADDHMSASPASSIQTNPLVKHHQPQPQIPSRLQAQQAPKPEVHHPPVVQKPVQPKPTTHAKPNPEQFEVKNETDSHIDAATLAKYKSMMTAGGFAGLEGANLPKGFPKNLGGFNIPGQANDSIYQQALRQQQQAEKAKPLPVSVGGSQAMLQAMEKGFPQSAQQAGLSAGSDYEHLLNMQQQEQMKNQLMMRLLSQNNPLAGKNDLFNKAPASMASKGGFPFMSQGQQSQLQSQHASQLAALHQQQQQQQQHAQMQLLLQSQFQPQDLGKEAQLMGSE